MLPFRLLYVLSDGFYILTYYIIGYRKKIVRENLSLTLPHLSDKERLIVEKKSFGFIIKSLNQKYLTKLIVKFC